MTDSTVTETDPWDEIYDELVRYAWQPALRFALDALFHTFNFEIEKINLGFIERLLSLAQSLFKLDKFFISHGFRVNKF